MRTRPTLQEQIETRITAKPDSVFLTREFADLSGERQVLRSLRKLVDEGKLMRLGYGIYARAEISPLTQQPMLAARNGFVGASREALTKLGIAWEPTEWETAYNQGRSTQVPVNAVVRLKRGRFSRRIAYRNSILVLER
jgi:hypothetical protein